MICLCIYLWDTCIYHLGVLSVYTNVYLWDTCLYYLGALSDFSVSRPLLYICLILLQCFYLNCLFFSKTNRVIISYFRFELRLPLSRTTVTWTEYCWYSVKHNTINQPFVCEELWSILLHTLKCYSKPILDPNTFNMQNISLPVSKNTKPQRNFG